MEMSTSATRDSEASPYVCWGVLLEHAGASKKLIPGPTDKKRGVVKRHLEATKRGKECATDFDDFRGVSDG